MEEEEYQKLKKYALKLLSFRPRTKKEISERLRQYCNKKNISLKIADQVINYLIEKSFINDEDFTKWWIDQRHSFRPKGISVIKKELLNKGVEIEVIEKELSAYKENPKSEYDLALKLIEKKINVRMKLSTRDKRIKISNLLARRGFSWDIIYQVIDTFLKKSYNSKDRMN